ncbi:MAG TPA: pirin family protein, partial [Xanthomonadaceae bacterium]|nr:pirin family protein [Xanthomonadaceae bacterium]
FDHMGPIDFAPGIPRSVDVRPHPHIGLSTVTYLFAGEVMHRDSVGSERAIRPGEVNWMTAGRGITHSERFERARAEGGLMHGIQAWVALPTQFEEIEPSFAHHSAAELPVFENAGATVRLLAGKAYGREAPTRIHSPLFCLHAELAAGVSVELPDAYPERAAFVAKGSVVAEGQAYDAGQMMIFKPDAPARLTASMPSSVMLFGGESLGERYLDWNFVSSSKARIEQAKADWRAGRMKLPDRDNQEFIPLPDAIA